MSLKDIFSMLAIGSVVGLGIVAVRTGYTDFRTFQATDAAERKTALPWPERIVDAQRRIDRCRSAGMEAAVIQHPYSLEVRCLP